jgi:hypothetical protein
LLPFQRQLLSDMGQNHPCRAIRDKDRHFILLDGLGDSQRGFGLLGNLLDKFA